jgi:CheY-like chemotaxis protein
VAKTKLLIVDDEEAIREVVSTLLEALGYECASVSNGRLAKEFLIQHSVDLVLSDMVMPEMDGLSLVEWLRKAEPDIPVIMVTAMHDLSTALEAIRRGAYDYILKPFEKDQLYLSVRRALEHRRLVLENRNYQRNLEKLVEERTAQLQGALEQLERSYDDTLEALGGALDLKDAETEGHCKRVTAFTIAIARRWTWSRRYSRKSPGPHFFTTLGKWPFRIISCASPVLSLLKSATSCARTAKSDTTW